MKRVFIAIKIEPSQALKSLISSFKLELKDERIKWTSLLNIHITLAFLGDTDENNIELIRLMLDEVCAGFGEFELVIKGAGIFKGLNDPRIIWTGIESSEKLSQLANAIFRGLKNTGTDIGNRPFNPHLTIGRIKSLKDRELLGKLVGRFQNIEIQKVTVAEIILFESKLLQTGPLYSPIYRFNL